MKYLFGLYFGLSLSWVLIDSLSLSHIIFALPIICPRTNSFVMVGRVRWRTVPVPVCLSLVRNLGEIPACNLHHLQILKILQTDTHASTNQFHILHAGFPSTPTLSTRLDRPDLKLLAYTPLLSNHRHNWNIFIDFIILTNIARCLHTTVIWMTVVHINFPAV